MPPKKQSRKLTKSAPKKAAAGKKVAQKVSTKKAASKKTAKAAPKKKTATKKKAAPKRKAAASRKKKADVEPSSSSSSSSSASDDDDDDDEEEELQEVDTDDSSPSRDESPGGTKKGEDGDIIKMNAEISPIGKASSFAHNNNNNNNGSNNSASTSLNNSAQRGVLDRNNSNGNNNNYESSPRIRQREVTFADGQDDQSGGENKNNNNNNNNNHSDKEFKSPPKFFVHSHTPSGTSRERSGSLSRVNNSHSNNNSGLFQVPPHAPAPPGVHFKAPPTVSPSLRASPAANHHLHSLNSSGLQNSNTGRAKSTSLPWDRESASSQMSTATSFSLDTHTTAGSMSVSGFPHHSTAGGSGIHFYNSSTSSSTASGVTRQQQQTEPAAEYPSLVRNVLIRAASPAHGNGSHKQHHYTSAVALNLGTASPPANVGLVAGSDQFPHNPYSAQQQQSSHGFSIGGQNRQRSRSQPGDHQQQHHRTFTESVADEIARVLAITTTETSTVLPQSELLKIGTAIAEKLLTRGKEYATSHYVDLCSSLELETHEQIREQIRTGALTPEVIASLQPKDLLTQSERRDILRDLETDAKNHDLKEITRQVALVSKNEECPGCGNTEAAVLDQGAKGGQTIWSGGEERGMQAMTLLQCLNCSHEWSREARY